MLRLGWYLLASKWPAIFPPLFRLFLMVMHVTELLIFGWNPYVKSYRRALSHLVAFKSRSTHLFHSLVYPLAHIRTPDKLMILYLIRWIFPSGFRNHVVLDQHSFSSFFWECRIDDDLVCLFSVWSLCTTCWCQNKDTDMYEMSFKMSLI